ncbi:hypothetical protein QWT69_05125 [Sporosarcina oncorhynchi]|uniref:Uncharacterized protein n=1 Tax=Sporosarcina oncorhynchi TaxID=3056444 RepID=A0ABZ0L7H1_9BACL|nr:hypothetical protein [Sporosarcina sp. T2O-4]WOV88501.1 hypothetical protein QWT69_05125 [Sporosarcina sp. T2O-4]
MTFGDSLESLFSSFMKFITAILVVCSARWRLQREQRELKTPQERAFRDEEAEAVPAESVHLERKTTGYLEDYTKRTILKNQLY